MRRPVSRARPRRGIARWGAPITLGTLAVHLMRTESGRGRAGGKSKWRLGGSLVALVVAAGAGQAIATTAADLCPSTADPCVWSGSITVTTGSILDFGQRSFEIAS